MQSGAVWLWRERRGADWRREPGRRPGGGAAAADEVREKPPGGRLGLRPGICPLLGPAEE